jgi:hypothetical protein
MRDINQALHCFAAEANGLCLQKHLDSDQLGQKLFKYVKRYGFGGASPDGRRIHPREGGYCYDRLVFWNLLRSKYESYQRYFRDISHILSEF